MDSIDVPRTSSTVNYLDYDNVVHKDFISKLPDDILISIIDRIPTKTAIATSILSKRWRNLYKSISILKLGLDDLLPINSHLPFSFYLQSLLKSLCRFEFLRYDLPSRCRYHPDCGLIIGRLERLLSLRSGSKIHTLDTECCLTRMTDNVFEKFIHHLGKSGIERLELSMACGRKDRCVCFPLYLLPQLTSLNYLALRCSTLLPNLNTKFPSLRTLYLSLCTIMTNSLECILYDCLSIESLYMFRCYLPPKLCFRGPNLKTLVMEDCDGASIIELHAENLSTFEFTNRDMPHFVFDHVPRLESVFFTHTLNFQMMTYVFEELPRNVKFLTIGIGDGFNQNRITGTFGNLRRLDIIFAHLPKINLLDLTPCLERCPVLEELHLNFREMPDYVDVNSTPPVVVHEKLKKVEMTGFGGTKNEIEFALYVLKSAVALEEMLIVRRLYIYTGNGSWREFEWEFWSERTLEDIVLSLQGQAVSDTAKLILRYKSCFPICEAHHRI